MLSLRLITTGLNDVHSVIGYELNVDKGNINYYVPSSHILIQPPEDVNYTYEAMHDVNGLSIPELHKFGKDRRESLINLVSNIHEEKILVWYKPFIAKFLSSVNREIGWVDDPTLILEDLYALAKQKQLASPSYKLADVYEFTGTTNMFELYDYLNALPEPKRTRRL